MAGNLWVDWGLLSISLFNTILILWLGLTILLNAERRSTGVWILGGGLLMGGLFFISHTAILGGLAAFSLPTVSFWWRIGWIPVVIAPYSWYVTSLWFAGFWTAGENSLRSKHRLALYGMTVIGLLIATLLIVAHPLPIFSPNTAYEFADVPGVGGVPFVLLLYPPFCVACIVLSIAALRRPGPTERMMGELARARTLPWLMGTSLALLAAGLLVSAYLFLALGGLEAVSLNTRSGVTWLTVWFDLAISGVIAVGILMLGQGVVTYEVFTGKSLPRQGFFRHWRSAVILAAGYGAAIGYGLVSLANAVASVLLSTVLLVTFYALFSWRSFEDREQFIARLRPFLSQSASLSTPTQAWPLFEAVCRDVLDTSRAVLIPDGIYAALKPAGLHYPPGDVSPYPSERVSGPGWLTRLEGEDSSYQWAIRLVDERGEIGGLFIGNRRDGGLYTQEEMEIARASGERLVTLLAYEALTAQLIDLQRNRLTRSRALDTRARRTLHDEVLPNLHTTLIELSDLAGQHPSAAHAVEILKQAHAQIADLIHDAGQDFPAPLKYQRVEDALRDLIATEFRGEFDRVSWEIAPDLPPLDPVPAEAIFGAAREAIRNAAVHGRGGDVTQPLHLKVCLRCEDHRLTLVVEDDGVGPDRGDPEQAIPRGSQSGLTLYHTLMTVLGGYVELRSLAEGGTQVQIILPLE